MPRKTPKQVNKYLDKYLDPSDFEYLCLMTKEQLTSHFDWEEEHHGITIPEYMRKIRVG